MPKRVVLDSKRWLASTAPKGVSRFQLLQQGSQDGLYYAFDLLYLDGFDLRLAPVIERKRVLAELLGKACGPILYSEHFEEDGGRDVRARLRHARSVDGAVTTPVPGYVARRLAA